MCADSRGVTNPANKNHYEQPIQTPFTASVVFFLFVDMAIISFIQCRTGLKLSFIDFS